MCLCMLYISISSTKSWPFIKLPIRHFQALMPAEALPMQRSIHSFQEIDFPCSVGRSCVVMPQCGVRSRAVFSNTWGATVFVVLHLGRSGALFFDSPWPSVSSLEMLFFRFGAPALPFSIWGRFRGAHVGARRIFKKRSHAALRSFLFAPEHSHAAWRSFLTFDISLGGPA